MPTAPNGLSLVFQYFTAVGFGVGFGLLIPFVVGVYFKNKIEEGWSPWRRKNNRG
ncbi:hypothetical protein P9314_05130 [Paenibacillus validus]|uniref:hypothetical protein n=1 Tax=Paenibacillus validus TaxID=44253 RepID=UPI0013E0BDD6|nr:hypothetical protein [Paenibacillus validus]MED4600092.1 hypothetical protein [Paenibacillus validus]MED4605540.1 hypothetical protein [Paenibacillus validus]